MFKEGAGSISLRLADMRHACKRIFLLHLNFWRV